MGYSLGIGEAVIDWSDETVDIDFEKVTLPDAPAFNEPTDRTNMRWPSYSCWADFCEAVGIQDVVMNERNGGKNELQLPDGSWLYCLMPSHPGAAPITAKHLAYIEDKIAAYKARHPDHIAQYPPPKPGAEPICGDTYRDEDLVKDERYDGNLCRAEWLLFWLRWAVANCKKPVFVNS